MSELLQKFFHVGYFLQAQSQLASRQVSDEQQPASHEQSGHPEFAQLQPIANSAVNIIKIFIFI